jgi:hypothetical protein
MKTKILATVILLFHTILSFGQVPGLVSGNLNITAFPTSLGGGKFQVSGTFSDPTGRWFAADVDTGMIMWKGNDLFKIDSIILQSGSSLTFRVVDSYSVGFIATGNAQVLELSPNLKIPGVAPSGDSNAALTPAPDHASLMNYIVRTMDERVNRKFIKRDTVIFASTNTDADFSAIGDLLGGRSIVTLTVTKPTLVNVNPTLPPITDTLLATKIVIKVYTQSNEQIGVFQSDLGIVESWDGTQYVDKSSTLFMSNDDEYTFWPVEDVNGYHWAYSKAAPASIPTLYTSNGTIASGTTRTVGLGSTGSLSYRTTPNNSYERKYMYSADYDIETGSDWYLRAGQPALPLSKSVQVYHSDYAQKYGGWTSDYSHQLRLERTATNNFSRILFRSAMNTDESEEKKEARLIIATDSVNLTAISALHMRSHVASSPRHQWAGLISNSYGNGGWGNEQARFISYLPSFKIQSNFHNSNTYYDWFKVDNLDQGDTTNYDAISVYNNKYRLPNKTPNTSSGVVNVLTWTGTGSAVTPGVQNIKNAITGTARVIPYMNSGGRLYAGNDYFKLDTNTTSGAQARVRLLINNPSGTAGEGDSYSSLSVRTGDGTTSESIMNFGDQALTNAAVGYDAVIQGYRTNGTFLSKSNLTNGQLVVKFAARGQANGGSRALGHFGITYTGDGTSINSELTGNSAVSGSVVAGFKLDNQSRFWLGSGANDYYFPLVSPNITSDVESELVWRGNGVDATPHWRVPKRDTTVSYNNLDYNLLTVGLTSAQVKNRYNNIIVTGYVPSSSVTSDALFFLPPPSADYNQVTIWLNALDENATYGIGISAGVNDVMVGDGTYSNQYPPGALTPGQTLRIRCQMDPKDGNNYKWVLN